MKSPTPRRAAKPGAMTSAQRQARRLALFDAACRAAGWGSWRRYVTAVINGRAPVPPAPATPPGGEE